MEENFARVETKYLLTLSQADQIEESLIREGFERLSFGSPTVQSLYYDTADYALIRASLERPSYKEKLRLRAYGEAGHITNTFLEIKKKYRGVVYKRRTAMGLTQAAEALRTGLMPGEAGQVGREALYMARRYGLSPAAVILYDRDAWISKVHPEVRITFDRNLSFRDWAMDLNCPDRGLSLIRADQRLMEIKTGGAYPLWLVRLLEEAGARRTHFSKYGLAYRKFIQPEKKDFEGSGAKCLTASLLVGA